MVSILFFSKSCSPSIFAKNFMSIRVFWGFDRVDPFRITLSKRVRETQRSQPIWKEVAAILGAKPSCQKTTGIGSCRGKKTTRQGGLRFRYFCEDMDVEIQNIQNLFWIWVWTFWGGVYLFYCARASDVTLWRHRCWCEHNLSNIVPHWSRSQNGLFGGKYRGFRI